MFQTFSLLTLFLQNHSVRTEWLDGDIILLCQTYRNKKTAAAYLAAPVNCFNFLTDSKLCSEMFQSSLGVFHEVNNCLSKQKMTNGNTIPDWTVTSETKRLFGLNSLSLESLFHSFCSIKFFHVNTKERQTLNI